MYWERPVASSIEGSSPSTSSAPAPNRERCGSMKRLHDPSSGYLLDKGKSTLLVDDAFSFPHASLCVLSRIAGVVPSAFVCGDLDMYANGQATRPVVVEQSHDVYLSLDCLCRQSLFHRGISSTRECG